MGNVTQTITFKGTFNVKDVIQNIDQIKKNLGDLSLGPGVESEFNKLFQKIERNTEKANNAMASGFKNKENVKAYEDAMRQISDGYDSIITKAKILSNSNKINLKVDDTAIKSLNSEMETLRNNINQAKDSLKILKASTGRDMGNIAKKYKGGAESWNNAVQAFKDGSIQKTDDAIKILENTIKGAQTKAQKSGKELSSDWLQKIKDVEALRDALENYKDAQNNIKTSETELAQKEKDLNDIMTKGSILLAQTADVGEQGAQAFRSCAKESIDAAKGTQQLNSELEHFKSKAAYFFGLSNAINLFKRAVRSAYDTVKDLDAVMTETAVVTDFSVGDMWSQLPEYTQRANELGVSIHSAYEAATIFYQQGLKTNEVMAVSNETLKMARIAGLDAAIASDRMTNAIRGFNMEMDKVSAQRVNDVYSELAAITASDTDEISTAMTKVASLAHNANMEFETTSAFLAQIIESTRESAETAGTALKTVVARFSEVKKLYSKGELMGQDEEGEEIDVNKVSTALRSAGINLNEYLTGAKGLDDIFIELASKWNGLDTVKQRYIATMAAGSRQQSRFIAMMSDYERTVELVDAANNANGASQEQYNKTLESLQTKLSRLKNAWDEFILGLTNNDVIKGAVDLLTNLITAINSLIKTVSGKNAGIKMITTFFMAFTTFKIGQKMFGGTQIAKMFDQLTNVGVQKAGQSAQVIAKYYNSSLEGSFSKTLKQDFGKGLDNNKLFNYFMPKKVIGTNFKINDKEAFRQKLFNDTRLPFLDDEKDKAALNTAVDTGKIEEVNKVLKEQESQLQINKENAEQFGVTCEDVTERSVNGWGAAAVAAAGAGAIIMGFGDWIKSFGEEFETAGTIVKALGTGLLVFGTIMSVTVPLMAKAGAAGISAAIYSIPIIGWISAVISAIVALGAAIYGLYQNDKYENKLQKASEASKKAADAADEATKAYENLGQAWDSLEDKYSAIDKATAGTQKWRDAIQEANKEVLNLVENYKDLDVEVGDDGRLIITNIDEVKEKLKNAEAMTQAARLSAQIKENRVKSDNTNLEFSLRDITGMAGEQFEWKGSDNKIYTEDIVREKLIEAYRNGQIKSTEGLRREAAKYLPESVKDASAYVSKIGDKEFNALKEYVNTPAFSESSKSQYNGFISNALANMSDKESIKYGKNLITTDFMGRMYENELKETTKDKNIDQKRKDFAKNSDSKDYETWKQDKNGGKDISDDDLNEQLTGQKVQSKLNDFVSQFEKNMNNLTQEQLKFFQEENGGALTKEEIDKLQGQGEDVYKKLGGDAVFNALGINKNSFVVDFNNAIYKANQNASIKIEGIGEELVNKLTAGARKSLKEKLDSIYTASGEEGYEQITSKINKIAKDIKDPKELQAFMDSLNSIDWTSANSVRSLSDLAKEYGISEDVINDLEEQIIKFNNAVTQVDLEKVTDQLKSLFGLGKKIQTGEQDRSFSEEEKNQLIEAGVDSSKFVYDIETGNYEYIGNRIQDVVNAIYDQTNKLLGGDQLEKSVQSGEVAKELIRSRSGNYESILQEYIDKAGPNSKISQEALNKAIEAKDKDEINRLFGIIKADADSYEDNKQKLDEYNFNKDVFANQMKSGLMNAVGANQGDEASVKALQAQISGSGLSKELEQKYLSGISNGDNAAIRQAGNLVDTFSQAKINGISIEDLNAYADALQRVEGLQGKQTDELYAMALAQAKYQQGMKSLVSSYGDWSKLIKKDGGFVIPQPDTDDFKIYEKMKEDVAKMLNSSEKIPDEFFKSKKNAELLKKAVKGSKKDAAALAANLAKINMGNLGFNEDGEDLTQKGSDLIDKIQEELPKLKIGTTFDEKSYAVQLAQLLAESGKTVDEVNKIMGNLGMTMQWEPEVVNLKSYAESHTGGQVTIQDPTSPSGMKTVPVDSLQTNDSNAQITILKPKKATFNKPPKTPPKTTKKKGKGGGGGKKAKKERWDNPYDELYNLQEKINESLRKREALERRYQKLLKQEQSSLSDIRKSYYDQIKQIRTEANLQKELEAGRRRQISNIGKETYVDSNGKVKTFDQMGVTKYAKYNFETGEIEMDWAGIQALEGSKNVEKGKAVEAYVSKLEELVQSYEEVRDKLWELEDKIEEFREAAIDAYLSFEDRVMDALVNQYQKEIDSYQAMSDAIDKVNDEVISSLREQIDLSRQIRDNTEKEEDISKKENRLAYLQRDTSGANDLEILSLQKELKDAREGYSDELVDQAIDKMQDDADKASEQRQRQIETMQAQLDIAKETGALWQEVYDLMLVAAGSEIFSEDSDLAKLLKDGEAFKSLSNIGQSKWWEEVGKAFREAMIGRDESEDKFKKDADNNGTIADTGTSKAISDIAESNTQADVTADTYERTDKEAYGAALAITTNYGKNHGGWGKTLAERESNLKEKGFNPTEVTSLVRTLWAEKQAWDAAQAKKKKSSRKAWNWKNNPFGITSLTGYTMSKFKTGGLADATGPAWLDGTKSHPELVLNAQDTRNFIALKDILASLMNPQNKNSVAAAGNVYLDIDINADIGSDYDVDKLASRIKKQIFDDGQYRNVNSINRLR